MKKRYDNILTEDFLRQRHIFENASINAIAKEIGCDGNTVSSYLHYYGIPKLVHLYPNRKMSSHSGWKGHGDISMTQFNNIKSNARTRKIDFTLSIEDLWSQYKMQKGVCALSGIEIGFVHNRRGNASLDRIDSSKPYELGNIWWVHRDINLAKQSLSTEEFIQLCRRVVLCAAKA